MQYSGYGPLPWEVAFRQQPEYIAVSMSFNGKPSMTTGQHTILVVEDEELLLELLKEMLEREGYRVITANDGNQAVNMYLHEKENISLVLSDMGLPGMGGWDVLRQLKAINPKVKVILSSGFMDTKVRQDMIRSGAKDFIQKPYTPEKVIQQIRASILSDEPKPHGS
jgi:two-component system, cell cycle sensor histidine kinase and response regulator CckA